MKSLSINLSLLVSILILASCSNSMSLEEYFVKKGQDNSYVAANLSSDVFLSGANLLPEEREKIASIRKINFLAFKKDNDTVKANYEADKTQLKKILNDEAYKSLMKFNGDGNQVKLVYTGNDVNIEELIVFAESDKMGFMVARLLGDDMKPKNFYNLVKMMDKLNLKQAESFTKDLDLSDI
ncbi:MAG: DUF4252 domain-containing protein [Psychroflexus sp.]|nr:DUF4252 domain-containing protein [Psychroflexus sp.]MDR9448472.1 DUF4252 domain-containing protein [Psychroflexus sp.]